MNRIVKEIIVGSAFALLVGSAGGAFAAEPAQPAQPAKPAQAAQPAKPQLVKAQPVKAQPVKTAVATPAKAQKMSGEIVSVDAAKNTLTIKEAKGEHLMELSPTAKLTAKGGKKITLDALKPGAKVNGTMIQKDGKEIVESLRVAS